MPYNNKCLFGSRFQYLSVFGISGVRQSPPQGLLQNKKVTIRWTPTPAESEQEKRLCFRAIPRLGG